MALCGKAAKDRVEDEWRAAREWKPLVCLKKRKNPMSDCCVSTKKSSWLFRLRFESKGGNVAKRNSGAELQEEKRRRTMLENPHGFSLCKLSTRLGDNSGAQVRVRSEVAKVFANKKNRYLNLNSGQIIILSYRLCSNKKEKCRICDALK